MSSPPSAPGGNGDPNVLRPVPSTAIPPDLIHKVLPGGQVHLFSGASGAGKTTLAFQMLAAAIHGTEFFGMHIRKPRGITGIIASDRRGSDHLQWMDSVGIANEVPIYSLIDDASHSGLKLTRGYLDARKDALGRFHLFERTVKQLCARARLEGLPWDSLIVCDPIALFLGGNLLDYDKVYCHMFDLNQFCVRYGVTLLGLTHASKQKADPKMRYARPQDRTLGTTAQTGCAGTTMHLSCPNEIDGDHHQFDMIPHHAPSSFVQLERAPDGLFVDAGGAIPTKRDKTAHSLLELLKPGEVVSSQDICDRAEAVFGLKRTIVYKYIAWLFDMKLLKRVSRGVWTLPDHSPN